VILDFFNKEEKTPRQRVVLSAQSDDLVNAEAALRKALGERNVLVKGCALDFDGGAGWSWRSRRRIQAP
jgi:hypothetical protein